MNLTAVITALQARIAPNGSLELVSAAAGLSQPDAGMLAGMLAALSVGAGDSFLIAGASLVVGATAAQINGTVTGWGVHGAPSGNRTDVQVVLDLIADGPAATAYRLALRFVDPTWTLGTTFAKLPETTRAQGPELVPESSLLAALPIADASLAIDSATGAKPQFRGFVLPSAFLPSAWTAFFPDRPLVLQGDLPIPADTDVVPAFTLVARPPGVELPLRNALLDFTGLALSNLGFGFTCDPGDTTRRVPAATSVDATATLRAGTLVARMSCPILTTGAYWDFRVDVQGATLVDGMTQLARIFGMTGAASLPTPDQFPALVGNFGFDAVAIRLQPGATLGDCTVSRIAVTISSSQPWTSQAPFVTLERVGITWTWNLAKVRGRSTGCMTAEVFGSLAFRTDGGGADPRGFHIDASVRLPGWYAMAQLRATDRIPLGDVLANYFGTTDPQLSQGMDVVGLEIAADPVEQTYSASALVAFTSPGSIGHGWQIAPAITLNSLAFHLEVSGGTVSGGLSGNFALVDGTAEPPLVTVAAEYPGDGTGWTFLGEMMPGSTIRLADLVHTYIDPHADTTLIDTITIDRLGVSIGTRPSSWTFAGAISGRWYPQILGNTTVIAARAAVDLAQTAVDAPVSGRIAGTFSVNGLDLTLATTLGVAEPVYLFQVAFLGGVFTATTAWIQDGQRRRQILVLRLGGVTVGQVLRYLVHLAAPTLGYDLPPPWNVLDRIELSNCSVTIDPETGSVAVDYAANTDLGFMRLDRLGIGYRRGQPTQVGSGSGVQLALSGMLLGIAYPPERPLSWDVVTGSPPTIPSTAPPVIDVRYIGIGQGVSLAGGPYATVASALAAMQQQLQPLPDPPPASPMPAALTWNPDSTCLIGLAARLMDVLDVGLVFNDPVLYGLSLALSGPRAGGLAGLRCEILYRRISDTLGVFRLELNVPPAYRSLRVGALALTLGQVVIEIYTNGDFRIDLGFPTGGSFARSFGLESAPFSGRGGMYLGLLDGMTSRRVPQATNGTFAPVVELGVGLAIGLQAAISVGPLSGSLSVQVELIAEGVLAWFHPTALSAPASVYTWAQGVAAIRGQVHGRIDFGVIAAAVDITAFASAMVVIESCRPTIFRLQAAVVASASARVCFIRVSFSYSTNIDVSFAIGTEERTPWILADAPVAAHGRARAVGPAAKRARTTLPHRRPQRRLQAMMTAHARRLSLAGAEPVLRWPRSTLAADGPPATVPLMLVPAVASDGLGVRLDGSASDASASTQTCTILLFAATAPADGAAGPSPAAMLAQALLRYCLDAIPDGPAPGDAVSAGQLAWLDAALADPLRRGDGFSSERLAAFFAATLAWEITAPDPAATASCAALVVPLPPWLTWMSDGGVGSGDVAYADADVADLRRMVDRLTPGARILPTAQPGDDEPLTIAARLFCDWCRMLATSAVHAARSSLVDRRVPVAGRSLAGIARALPTAIVHHHVRIGETVASLSEALGATVDELTFWNEQLNDTSLASQAGTRLTVTIGVSPDELAQDNPGAGLADGDVQIESVLVTVATSETLAGIAERCGTTSADLLARDEQATNARLLISGSSFSAPAVAWQTVLGTSDAQTAAAILFVRFVGVPQADPIVQRDVAWYCQALVELNPTALQVVSPGEPELPAGLSLSVPATLGDLTPASAAIVTRAGDTQMRIAAALYLAQVDPPETQVPGWPGFRDSVAAAGSSLPLGATVRVGIDETPTALARRLLLLSTDGSPDWSLVATWIGTAAILRPFATVTTDVVVHSAGRTLGALAADLGLAVAELGARVADQAGLLADASVIVRHLPADSADNLVSQLAATHTLAALAGEASQVLLSGQCLPTGRLTGGGLDPATLAPVLTATGQRFPVQSGQAAVWTLTRPAAVTWITLRDDSGPMDALAVTVTDATPRSGTTMTWQAVAPPAPLSLRSDAPVVYAFSARIAMRSATPIPIAGFTPGVTGLSLLPFPSTLLARTRTGNAYAIRAGGADDAGRTITAWAFATRITISIRRIAHLPTVFDLVGVPAEQQATLLDLIDVVSGSTDAGAPFAAMLTVPAPAAGAEIQSDVAWVAAANLSHEGTPPRRLRDLEMGPGNWADLSDPAGFARLLWQGTMLGGTGYQIGLGAGLDAGAFDAQGQAEVCLLVVRAQSAAAERPLAPSDNVLVVVDQAVGVEPCVSAQAVDPTAPGESIPMAVVPPGCVGLAMTLPAPAEQADPDDLRSSLNRLAIAVDTATGGFIAASSDQTAGQPCSTRLTPAPPQAAVDPSSSAALWHYQVVLPIARWGRSLLPAIVGLPPPASNPYGGLAAAGSGVTCIPSLVDLVGNSSQPLPAVSVPVGCTDPIIGPSAWPGFAVVAECRMSGETLSIAASLRAKSQELMPGPNQRGDALVLAVEEHRIQLVRGYYQCMQVGLTASLSTSLDGGVVHHMADAVATGGGSAPVVAGTLAIAAAAGCVAAAAATRFRPVYPEPDALESIASAYGVSWSALATANADVPLSKVFGDQPLSVPVFVVAGPGRSATDLGANQHLLASPTDGATVLALNPDLPLRVGATLHSATRSIVIPSPAPTLASLAASAGTTAGLLASDSADAAILAQGTLTIADANVQVGGTVLSFAAVAAAFAALGVHVSSSDLGYLFADRPDLLHAGATAVTAHVVAGADATLAGLAKTAGSTLQNLAQANAETQDCFDPGTLVAVGSLVLNHGRDSDRTLADYCAGVGCPPAALLEANAQLQLPVGHRVAIPGAVSLADPAIQTPYRIRVGDDSTTVTGRFTGACTPMDEFQPGRLLVCPLARIPAGSVLSDIPSLYGVSGAAFLQANAGVMGLIPKTPGTAMLGMTVQDNDTVNSLVARLAVLARDGGITSIADLAALGDLPLANIAVVLPPPVVDLTAVLDDQGGASTLATRLTVTMAITRPDALVHPEFRNTGVASWQADLSPSLDGTATDSPSARALATAYPTVRLATGAVDGGLWGVQLAALGAVQPASQPRFLARRPLYNRLVSRAAVTVAPLVGGAIDATQAVSQTYQAIDVENWADRFLIDLDRVLQPAPVATMVATAATRQVFAKLLRAKERLQRLIPQDLAEILDDGRSADPDGLAEARRSMAQRLGVSMAAARATEIIVQYAVAVPNPVVGAAFYGQPVASGEAGDQVRFLASRLSLAASTGYLCIPVEVAEPDRQSRLDLDLGMGISHLEIDRTSVPQAPGFDTANWLTLVPPLAVGSLPPGVSLTTGSIALPVPSRAAPAQPRLLAPPPSPADEDMRWTFATAYAHQHIAQDRLVATIDVGLAEASKRTTRSARLSDLFDNLARFITVADDLEAILERDADDTPTAIATFADLAEDIAMSWDRRDGEDANPTMSGEAAPTLTESFTIALHSVVADGQRLVNGATVTRATADGSVDWPRLSIRGADEAWRLTGVAVPSATTPTLATYAIDPPCAIAAEASLGLAWTRLDPVRFPNARIRIQAERNADMLGAEGPATAADFLMRTAAVTSPTLVWPAIAVAPGTVLHGDNIAEALNDLVARWFPNPTDALISLTVGYRYDLAENLNTTIPVGTRPSQAWSTTSATEVAEQLTTWLEANRPSPTQACWVIGLTLYSSIEPSRALAQADGLVYPISLDSE